MRSHVDWRAKRVSTAILFASGRLGLLQLVGGGL